ncbi:MAG: N-acetylneuraminate synthase family protein [Prosthecochloris sp.]|uniref:N-acetylneuraminate synthase family protein n=1 Tax=unclassified Prosthecochloris TaxID=2632826 RepID=UPI000DF758FA|nr:MULTISPECIES: N-acetylneuraminate synthase family protein [unclassified Prosthecochloris]MCW8797415.1 N-acetylneuraminate synthase family protein [Prosthecochloris sp.]RDD30531.1 N-acetylneuraminate synthase [Prosthecochloris sp. ZM]
MTEVILGGRPVGAGCRVFVIAEIGINHNGSLDIARQLIDGAVEAGCDAVKFQKRTPELCVPEAQRDILRDTPWGRMKYIEYRYRVEFDEASYREIDAYCHEKGILWFASCWDEEAVAFIERFDPPCYKAASASLTDLPLLQETRRTGRPMILSTGMSTMEEITSTIDAIGRDNLLLAHSNSTYPCPVEELNLRMIHSLQEMYPDIPVGYSGHEVGLATTWAAVALGATFIERHVTLDRAMWGSDQAASVELAGLKRLVTNIRDIEKALGDGVKRLYPGEEAARAKLRRR